ncbi:unnamed protein product [Lactuca saligna]|uniref:Reverse transcriptase zinc-binding domain-containing protein n=1 Tax=Lactuca saligna TaxID=75948 RepID=A0AA35YSR4_LACSI|nr:unnamed protein product [Lactuca saligna]
MQNKWRGKGDISVGFLFKYLQYIAGFMKSLQVYKPIHLTPTGVVIEKLERLNGDFCGEARKIGQRYTRTGSCNGIKRLSSNQFQTSSISPPNEVNVLCKRIDKRNPKMDGKFEWLIEVPIKVMTFVWREKMGRITIAAALSRRGVNLNSIVCCQCDEEEQTVDMYWFDARMPNLSLSGCSNGVTFLM